MADDKLMRGLGWLSLGLSSPSLLTPKEFAKALGVGDAPRHRATTVVVGVRNWPPPPACWARTSPVWLWARVGGDLMDLGMLGRALKNHDGRGRGARRPPSPQSRGSPASTYTPP